MMQVPCALNRNGGCPYERVALAEDSILGATTQHPAPIVGLLVTSAGGLAIQLIVSWAFKDVFRRQETLLPAKKAPFCILRSTLGLFVLPAPCIVINIPV